MKEDDPDGQLMGNDPNGHEENDHYGHVKEDDPDGHENDPDGHGGKERS